MQRQPVSVGCVLLSYFLMASVGRNVVEYGQVRLLRLTRLGSVSLRACVSVQIPSAQVWRQCLITAGLIRSRAVRRTMAALQQMPHLNVEIMPTSKFSNWSCPLCEIALPDKIKNPDFPILSCG